MRNFALLIVVALCGIFSFALSFSTDAPSKIEDVAGNESVTVHPLSLESFVEESPGLKRGDLVACSRLRIPGLSRLVHLQKFSHTRRVKVEASSLLTNSFKSVPKVDVCIHRNATLGLAQCQQDHWKALEKGVWSGFISPFETKYLDIRICEPNSDIPLAVSVRDENPGYRLLFLVMGVTLLLVAPLVSGWVPFYYTTAMTLGVLLVVLIVLYQSMKLLPTGRKSTLYIFLYGSMIGIGTVILHYVGDLVSSILQELGFSDDMYNPVAIFVGVGISLLGAWLGYWGVRKLVLAEDGNIDDGTAQFVKWAIRVVGSVLILQSSHDAVLAMLALFMGSFLAWGILYLRLPQWDLRELFQYRWSSEPVGKRVSFQSPRKENNFSMTKAQLDTLKRLPGNEPLVKWSQLGNLPSTPGLRVRPRKKVETEFVSTFHNLPGHKPVSKEDYKEVSREYTKQALKDLFGTKEFQGWAESQGDRLYLAPNEPRTERSEEEIRLTAGMDEVRHGLFHYNR